MKHRAILETSVGGWWRSSTYSLFGKSILHFDFKLIIIMLSSSDIHTNNNMSTLGSGGRGGGGGGGVYQQYFRSEFLDDSDSEMTTKSRQESLAEPAAGIRASEDEEDDLIVASIEDQWGPSFLGDVVEPSAAPQEVKVGEKRQEQYAPSAGGYLNEYDEDDDEEQGKKKGLGDILGDTMFIGTMPTATSEASFDNGETGKSYQGDMTKEGTEAKSNKRRNCLIWILSLGLLFGIILIVLGTTLGLKNRKENSSTTTDSDSASSKECFQTTQELYNAVDTYFEGSASSTSQQDLESQYGFPMNEWCVGNLTSFDFVFSAARNPDVVSMNEPLDKWDMSNAQSLEGMFLGASAFNQDISTWKTFSVRTFKVCS